MIVFTCVIDLMINYFRSLRFYYAFPHNPFVIFIHQFMYRYIVRILKVCDKLITSISMHNNDMYTINQKY